MTRHDERDPRFRALLLERAPRSTPDGLLQRAMKQVDQVTQERGWLPQWPILRFTAQVGALVAVLVLAIGSALVISGLQPPTGGPDQTPTATVSPTPGASPTPRVTPSPTPTVTPEPTPIAVTISGPATCVDETNGFSVDVPDGWYTNGDADALPGPCFLFAPEPFEITDPSALPDAPIILTVAPNGDFGFTSEEIIERSELTIAGLPALRFVTDTAPGRGLTYVVGLDGSLPSETNEGRFLLARTLAHQASYDRDSAALEEIIAGFEIAGG
jgi:hypothetical protein